MTIKIVKRKVVMNRVGHYTIPELLVKKLHLHWYLVTAFFALLLLAGMTITAIAADVSFNKIGWNFWRVGLQRPVIIIYILIIYPILTKMGDNAVESIIPLVDMRRKELAELDTKYRSPSRLWECISLSIGVLIVLILSQPWRGTIEPENNFLFITEIIMFGLLGLLIYYGFRNARYITLINKHLKLDVFNIDALTPITRWSLSISLAFVGGIVISIIFQNIDNL
jgi:hypothetical protein